MQCPYCAEEIQDAAIKCKHCGEWLKGPKAASSRQKQAGPRLYDYISQGPKGTASRQVLALDEEDAKAKALGDLPEGYTVSQFRLAQSSSAKPSSRPIWLILGVLSLFFYLILAGIQSSNSTTTSSSYSTDRQNAANKEWCDKKIREFAEGVYYGDQTDRQADQRMEAIRARCR